MVLSETEQPIEIAFDITESGANTFTELEVDLPVQLGSGMVFDCDLIEVRGIGQLDAAAAGVVSNNFQIASSTQTGILRWDQPEILAGARFAGHASAADTVGYAIFEALHMNTVGRANLWARPSVFLGIAGVNQGAAVRVNGRIVGSLVKVKQADLTQLVLSQID